MDMAVETVATARIHENIEHWEHTALTTELLLAMGTIVLSILGIVGVFPSYMAAIAVIALGTILLFQSGNVVLHYRELLGEAGAINIVSASVISRGITAEFLAGLASIVLGVLALLGIVPMTLLSVAVIIYGGTLMLTSGESIWLNSLVAKDNAVLHQLMHCMSLAAAGAQILAGVAGLVLGILALVGIAPIIMVLVALLATGTSILLRSSALEGFFLDSLYI
jgi:hypothetical protein